MKPDLSSPVIANTFERRDMDRRRAFEAGEASNLVTNIGLEEDEFGGLFDTYGFPALMSICAVLLASAFGLIVEQRFSHYIAENFVLVCVCLALATAIPLGLVASIRERRKWRSHKALRSVASLDPLTGLMNRRSFSVSIEEELKRMNRTGQAAAIILFDLDHFKKLNDDFGHHVGDEVLTKIASIAYSELRNPFDRLARWGGEEFIILLHDMSEDTARSVCERLRTKISELSFDQSEDDRAITASFGGSLLRPNQPFQTALCHADMALYEAKYGGRNRVEFKRCLDLAASNGSETF